jgi:hypothetical protein
MIVDDGNDLLAFLVSLLLDSRVVELAFIAHMLLERGDRLYQRCLATTSRRELWHTLRTAMHMLLVTAWADFLLIYPYSVI